MTKKSYFVLLNFEGRLHVAVIHEFFRVMWHDISERYFSCLIYKSEESEYLGSTVYIADECVGESPWKGGETFHVVPLKHIRCQVSCFEMCKSNWQGEWPFAKELEDGHRRQVQKRTGQRRLVFTPHSAGLHPTVENGPLQNEQN